MVVAYAAEMSRFELAVLFGSFRPLPSLSVLNLMANHRKSGREAAAPCNMQ
jgi:hypothetical protein